MAVVLKFFKISQKPKRLKLLLAASADFMRARVYNVSLLMRARARVRINTRVL